MKHPYIQFFTGDWLKDPALSICSPATRGIWMDLLCHLHELQNGGKVTATGLQIARICRCSEQDAHIALDELRKTNTADIYERDGSWTVICRRMKRAGELTAKRQQAAKQSHQGSRARPEYESEDEVRGCLEEYCGSIGLPKSDGTAVYFKWVGNGWTNAGKPIKDWKATIRTWKEYRYLPSQKQSGNGPKPECLRMSWPRDWQEAKRQVRFLEEKVKEHPEVKQRIEALEAQFKL